MMASSDGRVERDVSRSPAHTDASSYSGAQTLEIAHVLYRQVGGSAKLHVLSSDEEDGSFVDVLDLDAAVAFLLTGLEAQGFKGMAS